MTKLTKYNIINIVFLIAYIALVLANEFASITKLSTSDFWFPALCMIIGATLVVRAIAFKSDSAAWFSVFLVSNGITLFSLFYLPYSFVQLWPILFGSAAISSLFVGIFFKEKIHFKIFAYLAMFSSTFFLFSFKIINVVWFAVMLVIIFLAIFVGSFIRLKWLKGGEK